MDLNAGWSTKPIHSKYMHWTSGVCEESLTFNGTIMSEMLTSTAQLNHLYFPLLSTTVSLMPIRHVAHMDGKTDAL